MVKQRDFKLEFLKFKEKHYTYAQSEVAYQNVLDGMQKCFDAGTATAVEYLLGSDGIKVHTSTDGKGHEAIIIPDGGFRNFYFDERE